MSKPAESPGDRVTWPMARSALAASFGAMLSVLSATMLNVALDHLIVDFATDLATVQWISTGFLLALSLALPLTGWATSRVGIKPLYIWCLAAFAALSAGCAAAWSVESLIVFRLLQGIAGGLLAPLFQTVIAQLAGPNRMGRLMAYAVLPITLMPILGPTLGCLLIEALSWRWLFLVNVPLGLIGMAMAWRHLPAGEAPARRSLDVPGLLLVSPALALLVWGILAFGRTGQFLSWPVAPPLLAGCLLMGLFVLYARQKGPAGILDIGVFRRSTFALSCVATFVATFVNFGGQLILPLYLQQARDQSPLEAGLLLGAQGIGMLAGMSLFGRLADRVNPGHVAALAGLMALIGTLPFAFADFVPPLWLLAAALAVRGFGQIGVVTPILTAAYRGIDRRDLPNATTAQNMVQRTGAPFGTAILAVVLQTRLAAGPMDAAYGETFIVLIAFAAMASAAAFALARGIERHGTAPD